MHSPQLLRKQENVSRRSQKKKKSRKCVSIRSGNVLLPKQILRAHTYIQGKCFGGFRPELNAALGFVSRVTDSRFPVEKVNGLPNETKILAPLAKETDPVLIFNHSRQINGR